MTEPARGPDTAGGMLRAAREKQGLHIAALAAAIKVAPRKLDALENNRWDELPDATFARALAQTVCRSLKIDAKPVLDLLPAVGASTLENVAGTLNTPFRERGSSIDHGLMGAAVRPMAWAGALLLLAALAVLLLPAAWWSTWNLGADSPAVAPVQAFPASEAALAASRAALELPSAVALAVPGAQPAAPAASAVDALVPLAGAAGVGDVAGVAGVAGALPAALPSTAAGTTATNSPQVPASADAIQIKAVQASWVEARDAQGRVLISRLLAAGEELAIEGEKPVRMVIGNAAGVELLFRQQRVDLPALTRDNVARLQLP